MTTVGVDVGATLAKIAFRDQHGPRFSLLSSTSLEGVARTVAEAAPTAIGLTGGGASALEALLPQPTHRVNEFTAWGSGASALLDHQSGSFPEPYLLVSIGTGTSAMLVDGPEVKRAGGTALGGGAILGLGSALIGVTEFDELCALAARGSRHQVDLLVSDIYSAGEIALAGEMTAASFGKLARAGALPPPQDLATALVGLVGENVALICAGLAASAGLDRIVFGGATLRGNPALAAVLRRVTRLLGREAVILSSGEFAGALGALEFARQERAVSDP